MGSCIICGTSVDGHICDLHQEDVLFEFRGDHANQLTKNRYYRGSVDGFAEFGVFVDIGERVTGLLHRSELDRRLDSLDWDPGDTVFVKVKNVRDNGNVDLGWSIRQEDREFRGTLIDDPSFDHAKLPEEVEDSGNASEAAGGETSTDDASGRGAASQSSTRNQADEDSSGQSSGATTQSPESTNQSSESASQSGNGQVSAASDDRSDSSTGAVGQSSSDGGEDRPESDETGTTQTTETTGTAVVEEREFARVPVDELDDHVGEDVRLEGEVTNVRQTSGPTVFELSDESGTVDCAAFVEAGVRAYPDVVEADVVRLDGEVRERRGELQVETESLVALEDDERTEVADRLADALDDRARPDAVEPLADDPAIDELGDSLVDAATAIRKAVITDRPVIVRHSATADGYVAGVALERATLPLVREEHRQADAEYHYFDRRPLEGGVYDMDDATKDATQMLENRERHDEEVPLFVFVAAGGTRESLDGFELLDVYGAPRVVLDDADADDEVVDSVDTVVSPALSDAPGTTATALAANVAAHVNDDVRSDLAHLPAVSFWDDAPDSYVEAAADAGYDEGSVRELREAVALEAFYQSYEDKRELVTDLLFGDDETDVGGLAANVAEQFRTKLDTEVDTASANLDVENVRDDTVAILDTAAFTHGYDFPPSTLLLDELYRQQDVDVLVGVDEDTLYVRTDGHVDVHKVAWDVAERVPDAGVAARSAREQSIRFLAGERADVLDATVDVVTDGE